MISFLFSLFETSYPLSCGEVKYGLYFTSNALRTASVGGGFSLSHRNPYFLDFYKGMSISITDKNTSCLCLVGTRRIQVSASSENAVAGNT